MAQGTLTRKDRDEFRGFLRFCTNAQVQGVYDKEAKAGRWDYAELAEAEADRRGLFIETAALRLAMKG